MLLTLYTISSVFVFSILLPIKFFPAHKEQLLRLTIIPIIPLIVMNDSEQYCCKEKSDAGHSENLKGCH